MVMLFDETTEFMLNLYRCKAISMHHMHLCLAPLIVIYIVVWMLIMGCGFYFYVSSDILLLDIHMHMCTCKHTHTPFLHTSIDCNLYCCMDDYGVWYILSLSSISHTHMHISIYAVLHSLKCILLSGC